MSQTPGCFAVHIQIAGICGCSSPFLKGKSWGVHWFHPSPRKPGEVSAPVSAPRPHSAHGEQTPGAGLAIKCISSSPRGKFGRHQEIEDVLCHECRSYPFQNPSLSIAINVALLEGTLTNSLPKIRSRLTVRSMRHISTV